MKPAPGSLPVRGRRPRGYQMTITVFAKVPWPGQHMDTTRPPHSLSQQIKKPTKPREVSFEIGPPISPQKEWTCGTDFVWPILRVNGIEVLPENGLRPYLCRHQFEAGD